MLFQVASVTFDLLLLLVLGSYLIVLFSFLVITTRVLFLILTISKHRSSFLPFSHIICSSFLMEYEQKSEFFSISGAALRQGLDDLISLFRRPPSRKVKTAWLLKIGLCQKITFFFGTEDSPWLRLKLMNWHVSSCHEDRSVVGYRKMLITFVPEWHASRCWEFFCWDSWFIQVVFWQFSGHRLMFTFLHGNWIRIRLKQTRAVVKIELLSMVYDNCSKGMHF